MPTKDDVQGMWPLVLENQRRLNACPRHDFQPLVGPDKKFLIDYKCTKCQGLVEALSRDWYLRGLPHGAAQAQAQLAELQLLNQRAMEELRLAQGEAATARAQLERVRGLCDENGKVADEALARVQELEQEREATGAVEAQMRKALLEMSRVSLDCDDAEYRRLQRLTMTALALTPSAAAARVTTAAEALGHLHRGEWATNKERDELIDRAYAALVPGQPPKAAP